MISKELVKEKATEYEVPFANLLSGAVCETVIEILTNGHYCNELYLSNPSAFCVENYRRTAVTTSFTSFPGTWMKRWQYCI